MQTTHVQLSPGERAEIVVTMRPGERTVLRSYPAELEADFGTQRFSGGDDTLDILELRTAGTLTSSAPLPATLAPAPDLREADATTTRTFAMGGTRINRRHLDMDGAHRRGRHRRRHRDLAGHEQRRIAHLPLVSSSYVASRMD